MVKNSKKRANVIKVWPLTHIEKKLFFGIEKVALWFPYDVPPRITLNSNAKKAYNQYCVLTNYKTI